MNRRRFLMGVSATPIAWALQQYALTLGSFSGWLPTGTGHYNHLCWSGEHWFINGELVHAPVFRE
jgi:hypothetical protein